MKNEVFWRVMILALCILTFSATTFSLVDQKIPSQDKPCSPNSSTDYLFRLNGRVQTGIAIKQGDILTFNASGIVTFGILAGSGGPEGISGFRSYNMVEGDIQHGALVAQINEGEGWHVIGRGKTIVAKVDGILELAVNDADASNNSGQFEVQIRICRVGIASSQLKGSPLNSNQSSSKNYKTGEGDIPSESYNLPGILNSLYKGDFEKIADDQVTRNYVLSVAVGFNKKCPNYANDTSGAPAIISQYAMYFETRSLREGVNAANSGNFEKALLELLKAGGGGLGTSAGMDRAASHLIKEGITDGETFINNHTCDGLPTRHLHDNILKLASERGDGPPEFDNLNRFKAQMNPTLQQKYGYTGQPTPPSMGERVTTKCIQYMAEQRKAHPIDTVSPEKLAKTHERYCRCHIQSMVVGGVPETVLQSLSEFNPEAFYKLAERYPGYRQISNDNCYK